MSSADPAPEADTPHAKPALDADRVALLDRLAIVGTDLAEDLRFPPEPGQNRAKKFDLYGRNVRLSIMLARNIEADCTQKAAPQRLFGNVLW